MREPWRYLFPGVSPKSLPTSGRKPGLPAPPPKRLHNLAPGQRGQNRRLVPVANADRLYDREL